MFVAIAAVVQVSPGLRAAVGIDPAPTRSLRRLPGLVRGSQRGGHGPVGLRKDSAPGLPLAAVAADGRQGQACDVLPGLRSQDRNRLYNLDSKHASVVSCCFFFAYKFECCIHNYNIKFGRHDADVGTARHFATQPGLVAGLARGAVQPSAAEPLANRRPCLTSATAVPGRDTKPLRTHPAGTEAGPRAGWWLFASRQWGPAGVAFFAGGQQHATRWT